MVDAIAMVGLTFWAVLLIALLAFYNNKQGDTHE